MVLSEHGIAVLMSTYNGERYLRMQVESIRQQSYADWHLYIRDDGSTDSTREILRELAQNDRRITVIEGKNIGYVASFFELIRYADALGKNYGYYALSDQDDVWNPEKLQAAAEMLDLENPEMPLLYGSTSMLVTEDLVPYGITQCKRRPITLYNALVQTFLPGHSQMMNRPLLHSLAQTAVAERVYVHDLYTTAVAAAIGKVVFDNTPHTRYRQHKTNQIGFGKGKFSWLKVRLRRLRGGAGHKVGEQAEHLYQSYANRMPFEQRQELRQFLESRTTFFSRLHYVLHSKIYRQKKLGTLAFKVLYLFGGFNSRSVMQESGAQIPVLYRKKL